jgi:hypothetical protein
MRRWFADVKRAGRVTSRYSAKNKNDILDFMAQRIEVDRNPLADTDLFASKGQSLASFVKSSSVFDTQLGDPTESHKATTIIMLMLSPKRCRKSLTFPICQKVLPRNMQMS